MCFEESLEKTENHKEENAYLSQIKLLRGNNGLPHYRQILYQLSHRGSPQWLILYIIA